MMQAKQLVNKAEQTGNKINLMSKLCDKAYVI